MTEIRDRRGRVHRPPYADDVVLAFNWSQNQVRLHANGSVERKKT